MTDTERLALVRQALAFDAGFDLHRLAWLRDLLAELDSNGWQFIADDPSVAAECRYECRQLLDGLTAAFKDELDAQLDAERAALGEGQRPDDGQLPS